MSPLDLPAVLLTEQNLAVETLTALSRGRLTFRHPDTFEEKTTRDEQVALALQADLAAAACSTEFPELSKACAELGTLFGTAKQATAWMTIARIAQVTQRARDLLDAAEDSLAGSPA